MANPTKTGAPRVPPGRKSLAVLFARLNRDDLEEIAEVAIAQLDVRDGDVDVEVNGDELDGTAGEDDFYPHGNWMAEPGCPVSDPGGDPLDAGELDETYGLMLPTYGLDQSKGPTNELAMYVQRQRAMLGGARA